MKTEKILWTLLLLTLVIESVSGYDLGLIIVIEFTLVAMNYMPFTIARLVYGKAERIIDLLSGNYATEDFTVAFLFSLSMSFSTMGFMFYIINLPGWMFILVVSFLIGLFTVVYHGVFMKKWGRFLLYRFLCMSVIFVMIVASDFRLPGNIQFVSENSLYNSQIPIECLETEEVSLAISCAIEYKRNVFVAVYDRNDIETQKKIDAFKGQVLSSNLMLRLYSDENEMALERGFYIINSREEIIESLSLKSSYADFDWFVKRYPTD